MALKTKEQMHRENLERIAKYRPIDDDFMRELFRDDIPLTEMMLRIITGKSDLSIIRQETQYDLNRLLGGRSLRFDIFATDSENRRYNLEIQRSDGGASPKRARYHSSAIDVEVLNANDDFEALPITYVIFITENDIMGENMPMYCFEWRNIATGKALGDGANIIYVNAAYDNKEDNSDIAKLMHDFKCSQPEEMHFELLAEKAKYFKKHKEGVDRMCKINEEMVREAAIEAAAEAARENSIEIAEKMIVMGKLSYDDIADVCKLTLSEVEELAQNLRSADA